MMEFGEGKALGQNLSPKLGHPPFTNRKASSRKTPRKRLPWPAGKPFKILSLDGGGIRGIYTACLLHKIESELCNGSTIGDYFDLVAGTSTGGIIAVGIGFSVPTDKIVDLYLKDGGKIFLPVTFKNSEKWWSKYVHNALRPKYDHQPLEAALFEVFGEKTFGQSKSRLVIPSCMVPKSEIAVFKTDHHGDYQRDHKMAAWEVCRATSAAPTYFAGHERNGRMFVDGGLWANNPIMVAAAEALSCFEIEPSQIKILSIGTGNKPFVLPLKKARGGWFHWKFALTSAMHLSTDNSTSQAGLFIGDENVTRIEPESQNADIEIDDWVEAKQHLPDAATVSFSDAKSAIEPFFKLKVATRMKFYSKD
jgi:uncharacterized protein